MIESFIKIRLKQFYRRLNGIGLIRVIFLMGLAGFFIAYLFITTSEKPGSYYVTGMTFLFLLWIQINRQDKLFLKTNFDNYRLVLFAEYLLLASIVIVFLIIHLQWVSLLSLLLAMYLTIHLDLKTRKLNLNTKIQQLIPNECFEWKGGIRKTLFIQASLWLIGLCTSFFMGSVPIVLFILGIFSFSFYEKGEPYQMIIAYEKGPNQFLLDKIRRQITLYSIVTLPLIAAFMVFHHQLWYIPVIEYFVFISLYVYLILTKYAFYESNTKPAAVQFFSAFGAVSVFVPVFLPLIWLLTIRFFFKSKENLNLYLNDYN